MTKNLPSKTVSTVEKNIGQTTNVSTTDEAIKKGTVLNVTMNPVLMREWEYIRETPKCIVVDKMRGGHHKYRGEVYLPKKDIYNIKIVKKK